jgi:hypothetical protein
MMYILSRQSAYILIHDTWPMAKIVYISASPNFTVSLVRNFNKMCWHQHNLCNSTPTCAVDLHSLGTNQVYNYPRSARLRELYRYSARTHANRRESKSITGPRSNPGAWVMSCERYKNKLRCIWQCARVDLKWPASVSLVCVVCASLGVCSQRTTPIIFVLISLTFTASR